MAGKVLKIIGVLFFFIAAIDSGVEIFLRSRFLFISCILGGFILIGIFWYGARSFESYKKNKDELIRKGDEKAKLMIPITLGGAFLLISLLNRNILPRLTVDLIGQIILLISLSPAVWMVFRFVYFNHKLKKVK